MMKQDSHNKKYVDKFIYTKRSNIKQTLIFRAMKPASTLSDINEHEQHNKQLRYRTLPTIEPRKPQKFESGCETNMWAKSN